MKTDIRDMDIRRVDGGLLLVFRELLRRGRATEAGARLGLSQPAVSHALARLRDLFGDPLFVRKPHGLEPTARAIELGPQIEALIDQIGAVVSSEGGFDPARSERSFRLGGTETYLAVIAPRLIAGLRAEAPKASVRFLDMLHWQAVDALRRGEADVAVGRFGTLPAGLASQLLYEDRYCVVARIDHPRIKGRLSQRAYRETGHIFTSAPAIEGRPASISDDDVSAIYGKLPPASEVAPTAYVPRFTTALMLAAETDAIADVPRRLAERHAQRLGLQILPLPYDLPPFRIEAVRRANTSDSGIDWLWEQVQSAAKARTRRGGQTANG